jgi:hypothetical protein
MKEAATGQTFVPPEVKHTGRKDAGSILATVDQMRIQPRVHVSPYTLYQTYKQRQNAQRKRHTPPFAAYATVSVPLWSEVVIVDTSDKEDIGQGES